MKEKLITFKTAKLAKEKKFNLEVKASWGSEAGSGKKMFSDNFMLSNRDMQSDKNGFTRPSQTLLQKWLREKHNIDIVIKPMTGDIKGQKNYAADVMIFGNTYYQKLARADSYEDALENGLYEALNHLTV